MESTEELQSAIEALSEHEVQRLQLLKEIAEMAATADIEELNQLPALYRIELKQALRESGEQRLADQIRS